MCVSNGIEEIKRDLLKTSFVSEFWNDKKGEK